MTAFALPYLAAARLSGPDAQTFLQAQLSADVTRLEDGGATFACYCSPRGQVIGLLLVCRAGAEYLVIGSASLLPGIVQRLRLFVLRARVQLALAPEWDVCGLEDPEASAAAGAFRPPGSDLAWGLRSGGELSAAGAEFWKELELRRRVAWLGPETTERFIPQMLGFDEIGAVSFSKGCYPGQEIVARAKYLGRVKRKPLNLLVESAPIAAGSAVRLSAGGESLEATVVDSAPVRADSGGTADQSVVLVVSPEAPGPVESLDLGSRTYRCATM